MLESGVIGPGRTETTGKSRGQRLRDQRPHRGPRSRHHLGPNHVCTSVRLDSWEMWGGGIDAYAADIDMISTNPMRG